MSWPVFGFAMPGPTEMIVVLVVCLLLFGAEKLPQLGKSLGGSMHAFKRGLHGEE
ncbi:MAG: twin-arginine translocase TatA/TatE family subunit [Planctomycetales bacterium]|nr:twin-arginine translocase TatA/TatE family subunit [Planctomycetales bacterium]